MGNRHSSTVINASSTALTAVSQAFLALSQDISQSTLGSQTIIVNCAGDKKQKYCDQCEAFWATHNKNPSNTTVSPADIGTLCAPICQCILSNVDLSQHIKVNLSAFANNSTSDAFITQVNNSINQQAYDSGSSIFPSSSTTSNLNQSVEQIYQGMQSDSFQTQIQGLLSLQTVSLTGAGNIAYVTLNSAVDFISKLLESNSETSQSVSDLAVSITQISTQITSTGLAQLALLLLQIICLVVLFFVGLYASNLIIELYTLYIVNR